MYVLHDVSKYYTVSILLSTVQTQRNQMLAKIQPADKGWQTRALYDLQETC